MLVLYHVHATTAAAAAVVYHAIALWIPAVWGTIAFIRLRRSRTSRWRRARRARSARGCAGAPRRPVVCRASPDASQPSPRRRQRALVRPRRRRRARGSRSPAAAPSAVVRVRRRRCALADTAAPPSTRSRSRRSRARRTPRRRRRSASSAAPARPSSDVTVVGSQQRQPRGRLEAYSTGTGESFIPSTPFTPGEKVTVSARVSQGATHTSTVRTSFSIGFEVADQPGAVPDRPGQRGRRPALPLGAARSRRRRCGSSRRRRFLSVCFKQAVPQPGKEPFVTAWNVIGI